MVTVDNRKRPFSQWPEEKRDELGRHHGPIETDLLRGVQVTSKFLASGTAEGCSGQAHHLCHSSPPRMAQGISQSRAQAIWTIKEAHLGQRTRAQGHELAPQFAGREESLSH